MPTGAPTARSARSSRWSELTDAPLMVAAVAFLAAYAWPILDPRLSAAASQSCIAVTWTTWALFAVDYLVRIRLADDRRRYVLHHLADLAVILLPLLRPLRLLRLLTVFAALNRRAGASLRGRVAIYVAGSTVLLSCVAALAMLDAERQSAEANITTIGDALWWALTTVTTVGYGDRFPVTTEGRTVAFGLMLAGIALLGVVTASLASWLIERVAAEGATERAATAAQVDALAAEVRALRVQLGERPAPPPHS